MFSFLKSLENELLMGPVGPTGPVGPMGPVAPVVPMITFSHVRFILNTQKGRSYRLVMRK